jgi:hypothetical protein
MENQSNQATKKGIILLLGVIIGLLVGVLVAFIIVGKLNLKSPSVVKVMPPSSTTGTKDTVYKYIVHQYESSPAAGRDLSMSDSTQIDSMFVEDYSMDYMLEEDDPQTVAENENTNVTSTKMISKYDAPILYFDAKKNAMEVPSGSPKFVEVQFWSTPVQNKLVYQFSDNTLKIKGLKYNEVYVIHYNNHYYLQSDKNVYLIQPNTDFQRLTAIHDIQFFK